jgi:hypothetical protein
VSKLLQFFFGQTLHRYYLQAQVRGKYLNSPRGWNTVCTLNVWSRAEADELALAAVAEIDCFAHRVIPDAPDVSFFSRMERR